MKTRDAAQDQATLEAVNKSLDAELDRIVMTRGRVRTVMALLPVLPAEVRLPSSHYEYYYGISLHLDLDPALPFKQRGRVIADVRKALEIPNLKRVVFGPESVAYEGQSTKLNCFVCLKTGLAGLPERCELVVEEREVTRTEQTYRTVCK